MAAAKRARVASSASRWRRASSSALERCGGEADERVRGAGSARARRGVRGGSGWAPCLLPLWSGSRGAGGGATRDGGCGAHGQSAGPPRLVLGDHERLPLGLADGGGALRVAVHRELELGGERGSGLGLPGALALLLARRDLPPVAVGEERGLRALAGAQLRGEGSEWEGGI